MTDRPSADPPDAEGDRPLSPTQVLDTIESAARKDKVTLGEILDAFGRRAYGPFLLVPALVAVLPVVGALPGVSIVTALIDLVVAVQLVLGQRGLKLPDYVRHIGMSKRMLSGALRMVRPAARWTGRFVRPRLEQFTNGGARFFVGVLALFLALLMVAGSLVPGGSVVPALAMIVLGIGLTSHDGVLVLASLTIALGSGWLAHSLIF